MGEEGNRYRRGKGRGQASTGVFFFPALASGMISWIWASERPRLLRSRLKLRRRTWPPGGRIATGGKVLDAGSASPRGRGKVHEGERVAHFPWLVAAALVIAEPLERPQSAENAPRCTRSGNFALSGPGVMTTWWIVPFLNGFEPVYSSLTASALS